jgi:Putative zinc dependent peptidase (DUF5700)
MPALAACAGSPEPPPTARPAPPEAAPRPARAEQPERIALRIDTGEAEAVLAIIEEAAGSKTISESSWRRLFDSTGYRLLKAREESMQRRFDDDEFRAFVLSPALAARAPALRTALEQRAAVDLRAAAERVMAYLPAEARIAATVFPVLKPKDNSFVYFADESEPSIFLYIDPAESKAEFENTVAHELHHIGYSSLLEEPCGASPAVCTARKWTGAFGEGFAMLAAAGGPDVHPRATARPERRARWDRDVVRFDRDLRLVQDFLRAVLAGELDEAATERRAMEFFGLQGPWYTVGWSMAVAVERCFGRARLVEAMRRPWTVLTRYNQAVARCPQSGAARATWGEDVLRQLDPS